MTSSSYGESVMTSSSNGESALTSGSYGEGVMTSGTYGEDVMTSGSYEEGVMRPHDVRYLWRECMVTGSEWTVGHGYGEYFNFAAYQYPIG